MQLTGDGSSPPRRVAVLRALQLGDLLCAVPALRALRAALPDAQITLVGLPWASSFVERFSAYVDDLLVLPGFPGLPEQPPRVQDLPAFLATAQARQFDLALQMQGDGSTSNVLLLLLGAQANAGFFRPGNFCPDSDRFFPYPDEGSETERLLSLLSNLGIPSEGQALEFPLTEGDVQELAGVSEAKDILLARYIVIHPGARSETRRWAPERFAEVANALAAEGNQVVLTGSPDEVGVARAVEERLTEPCVNLAGKTSLGALGAVLWGARLLISNDTGVAHVAEGLGVPSVIVFTGSDPQRWAASNRELHRVLRQTLEAPLEAAAVIGEARDVLDTHAGA